MSPYRRPLVRRLRKDRVRINLRPCFGLYSFFRSTATRKTAVAAGLTRARSTILQIVPQYPPHTRTWRLRTKMKGVRGENRSNAQWSKHQRRKDGAKKTSTQEQSTEETRSTSVRTEGGRNAAKWRAVVTARGERGAKTNEKR